MRYKKHTHKKRRRATTTWRERVRARTYVYLLKPAYPLQVDRERKWGWKKESFLRLRKWRHKSWNFWNLIETIIESKDNEKKIKRNRKIYAKTENKRKPKLQKIHTKKEKTGQEKLTNQRKCTTLCCRRTNEKNTREKRNGKKQRKTLLQIDWK